MTRLVLVNDERIILLESGLPPAELVEAVQSGAWQPPGEAVEALGAAYAALRAVRLGRLVIVSPSEPGEGAGSIPPEAAPLNLSPRQLQVLQGLADGLSSKQIAAHLGVSKRTVDLHISAIKRRFGTTSRMQSVLRGVALGLCKFRPEPAGKPVFPRRDVGYTCPVRRGPSRSRPPRKDDEERTLPDPADQ